VREGFLPRTVRRYLAELLGQGSDDPLDAPAATLDVSRLPTGAPRIDRTRLESLGREDFAALDITELLRGTVAEGRTGIEPLVREFAAESATRGELDRQLRCTFEGPLPADLTAALESVPADDIAVQNERWAATLDSVIEALEADIAAGNERDGWAASLLSIVRAAAKQTGIPIRDVMRPIRIAISASVHGPALDMLLTAIGMEETVQRATRARLVLDARTPSG
jgi:glutamyl/glutaminyl-tRNA synthetase